MNKARKAQLADFEQRIAKLEEMNKKLQYLDDNSYMQTYRLIRCCRAAIKRCRLYETYTEVDQMETALKAVEVEFIMRSLGGSSAY